MDARRITYAAAWGALLLVGALPLLVMVLESFRVEGAWSLAAWQQAMGGGRFWTLFFQSAAFSVLVALSTLLAGVPLGLLLGRSDLPGRVPLLFAYLSALLVPPYVWAVGWGALLSPGGPAASLLGEGAAAWLAGHYFGPAGLFFLLFGIFLPIPMLLSAAAVRAVPADLEEAARLVAPWPTVVRRVTLPLIAPSLRLSFVLVFLLVMGETTVAGFLRVPTFAMESLTQFAAFYDFSAATASAVPLLLLALALTGYEKRREKGWRLQGSASVRRVRWHLPRGYMTAGVLALPPLGAMGLALWGLAAQSGGLSAWLAAAAQSADAAGRSLLYAAVGATLLTLLGLAVGYGVQRREMPLAAWADGLTLLLFALPGSVAAVGLIALSDTPLGGFAYGTPLLLVAAYLARYALIPARLVASRLALLPRELEEAARLAGASWGVRMGRIVVPLLGRALASAWLAGYLFCLRDSAATTLLYVPGRDTLGVRLLTSMANGEPAQLATLSLLSAALALPAALGLWAVTRKEAA